MTSRGELTFADRLFSCIWALAVGAVAFLSNAVDSIPVESADSFLIAFNLRPPEHLFPLLWHNFVSVLSAHLGCAPTMRILNASGPAALAMLAFLSSGTFTMLLPHDLRTWGNARRWGRVIAYVLPILGSAAFVFSPSVWAACKTFTPETQMLVLFLLSVFFAVRSLECGGTFNFAMTAFVSGVLAAETPLALLVPVVTVVYLYRHDWQNDQSCLDYLADPLLRMVVVKWMAVAFAISWIGATALNMHFFLAHGGVGAEDGVFFQIVRLFLHYFSVASRSVSPFGLMFLGIAVVSPLVFSAARIKRAADTTQFLLLRHSFFFLLFGVLALLQSSPFSSWWFWRWVSEHELVSSHFLLAVSMSATAYVVFAAICVFVVDVYFRNTRLLVGEHCRNEETDVPLAVRVTRIPVLSGRIFRLVQFPFLVVLVFLVVVPGHFGKTQDRAHEIIQKYIGNVLRECGDAPVLITDGSFDSAIELASVLGGKNLKTLSIMSGDSEYDIALRKRVDDDGKYGDVLALGTADALRKWMREESPMISNLAVQVGFELWRYNRKRMPLCGGLVALTSPSNDVADVKSAYDLAAEVLMFREEGDLPRIESPAFPYLLSRIQWRLSRMCRMRAYAASRANDSKLAAMEEQLADRLDAANPEWLKVCKAEDSRLKNNVLTLTPREGLNLSLKRADFKLAGNYAREVLAEDVNDVPANFAMAMGHFESQKFNLAEEYLKRALARAPEEPAILNNLAVVLIRLDRYEEAETNAVKALRLLPDSEQIKETLRRIHELKNK